MTTCNLSKFGAGLWCFSFGSRIFFMMTLDINCNGSAGHLAEGSFPNVSRGVLRYSIISGLSRVLLIIVAAPSQWILLRKFDIN